MPPRKRIKLSPAENQEQQQQQQTQAKSGAQSQPDSEHKPGNDPASLVADPWSPEQETALLKGIIRWKPVGMHKHFRMLAISDFIKSQGHSPIDEPHTRIPGIWKKLSSMYNLAGLDEREDPTIFDASEEYEEDNQLYCPFELPVEEYGEMMFARRLALDGMSSPPMSMAAPSVRGSTVAETDEPRSSPAPTPAPRGRGRPPRGARHAVRSTRQTRLQAAENQSRDQARDKDKASVQGEDEAAEDAEEEESEEEKKEEEEEKETAVATPPATRGRKPQSTRGKGRKGRGAGRRGRRR